MYEVRRMHFDNPDAHLRYIGTFFLVEKEISELLNPTQVDKDTAVQINIGISLKNAMMQISHAMNVM